SSVALREVIILILMVVAVYYFLVDEKMIVAFILSIPLIFFKAQNFLILMLTFSIYHFFKVNSIKKKFFLLFVFFFVSYYLKGLVISRFSLPSSGFSVLGVLDNYRNYMYYEETRSYTEGYIAITDWLSLTFLALKGFFYMLFKPFPWECENILQLMQSIENIVIIGLICYVNTRSVRLPLIIGKIRSLNLLLLISMSVYGLVVFNFGSAARYRFPFMAIYFAYSFYLLKSDKLFGREEKAVWNYSHHIQPTTFPLSDK
ncbi:uncharacterized protein METZ01_LOCUS426171, partial [marine metagenome]